MLVREEQPEDIAAIRRLTDEAFRRVPYSNQKEAAIIEALRSASALTLSLVADEDGALPGHVLFHPCSSMVLIATGTGLGPYQFSRAGKVRGLAARSSAKVFCG